MTDRKISEDTIRCPGCSQINCDLSLCECKCHAKPVAESVAALQPQPEPPSVIEDLFQSLMAMVACAELEVKPFDCLNDARKAIAKYQESGPLKTQPTNAPAVGRLRGMVDAFRAFNDIDEITLDERMDWDYFVGGYKAAECVAPQPLSAPQPSHPKLHAEKVLEIVSSHITIPSYRKSYILFDLEKYFMQSFPQPSTEWKLQHNLLNTLKDVAEGHYTPRFAIEIIVKDFGHSLIAEFGQEGGVAAEPLSATAQPPAKEKNNASENSEPNQSSASVAGRAHCDSVGLGAKPLADEACNYLQRFNLPDTDLNALRLGKSPKWVSDVMAEFAAFVASPSSEVTSQPTKGKL